MFPQYENLSVEEMLQKQIELKQKMAQALGTGMSSQVVDQIQNMLDYLNTEILTKVESEKIQQAIENGEDPNNDGISLNIGD